MNFGKNLQYLRRLSGNMTQEQLAEKLNVSRQTVSKWELDAAQPEITKAVELCKLFSCTLDDLFRSELDVCDNACSNLRVELVPAFRYIAHTVISTAPESDAIDRVRKIAAANGVENPKVIGWDFPFVSQEQINVHHMHGYTAAWVLPESITAPTGCEGEPLEPTEQKAHRYAAIHIENPFINPFATIPNAYRTLMDYMRINGLEHVENDVLPCYETDGDTMDIYIACK
ncbi:MAG: helix-turn-helix transcriptional regulator [Ruminococcaceae bacterium]|nr:helix-turn-helix transcriptional regulator [Oscillospiraceae bacterium]